MSDEVMAGTSPNDNQPRPDSVVAVTDPDGPNSAARDEHDAVGTDPKAVDDFYANVPCTD